ncbi:MAG: hypothetical protein AAF974_01865 [Cyanobacteria bacterium P01_E01_bin.34]
MNATKQRLAVGLIGLATLFTGTSAIAQEAPMRFQAQRAASPQRVAPQSAAIVAEPVQPVVPQVTHIAQPIPPRPEMCVPDYSWFDYEKWEWICVGHL